MQQQHQQQSTNSTVDRSTKAVNLKKLIPSSNVDFNGLVKEFGYVKARQHLQRESVKHVQNEINTAEIATNVSLQPLRLNESLRIAKTFGPSHSDAMAEKILKINPKLLGELSNGFDSASIKDLLSVSSRQSAMSKSLGEKIPSQSIESIKKDIGDFNLVTSDSIISDSILMHCLRDKNGEISAANQDTDSLPVGFGDTIFLQLGHVQRVSCTRNNLPSYISYKIPQLSSYHLRNVREMNLSLNKIRRLPNDFGLLSCLETLNLSNNMLSELPKSVGNLKKLRALNLSHNNLTKIQDELMLMESLETLNLSKNILSSFPYALCRLLKLTSLDMSFNACLHLAIYPPLLKPKDMWIEFIDKFIGKVVWMNIFTRERVAKIEFYDGEGVKKAKDLHVFQPEENVRSYNRRKMWLSICQTYEWEPLNDPQTGKIYFQNNVSGASSWEMPAVLDTLGTLSTLTEFTMTHNSINEFPKSISKLVYLKKLAFRSNKLTVLSANVNCFKYLNVLDLSSNELQVLPDELCECLSLAELNLNDNSLLRLPEALGYLPNLNRLDISTNRLSTIPFSLGHCASLAFLNASENPMRDPPLDEFSKGLESVKWYCRNRLQIVKEGMPPEMRYHSIGILQQVTVLKQEFDKIISQMISAVGKNGLLNLQLMGLNKIPGQVIRMTHLKQLKLDFNDKLYLERGFPEELSHLTLLSLRACKMPSLPENMSIFTKLTTLNLEDNRLERLPEEIVDIRTLTVLDISKNRLYSLPDDIEYLKHLKTLMLESNYLEYVPNGVGKLTALKLLNIAKNRIVDFPNAVCDLTNLKLLNLEKNRLQSIPLRIAQLNVVDLRIGHNRIEYLPDDLFASNLGRSIQRFSVCENNLLELPASMYLLDKECFVEGDYNPLISPPSYLLAEGLVEVQNYLEIRQSRKNAFLELTAEEDFYLDPASLSPIAVEVLKEGTGFLTPDDLAEFDQAVDELLNGEYFKCPSSARELVDAVVQLRAFREDEIYLNVLHTFLKVVGKIASEKDRRFMETHITTSQRPWGINRELCNVWVISLQSILRNMSPNIAVANGRPSLFSMIQKVLPPMAFPFTVDLLKDSLRLYQSAYGQVADTEEFEFTSCDCVDEARNKPKRHNPCLKAAVVLVKCIYLKEEAEMRAAEEEEYFHHFEDLYEEMQIWIETEEGKKMLDMEITKRKTKLKEEIAIRNEMLQGQQVKMKKAQQEVKKVIIRRTAYEEGEPFSTHNFHSLAEAVKEQNIAEGNALLIRERIDALSTTIRSLTDTLNLDYRQHSKLSVDDLMKKYLFRRYKADLTKYRRQALEKGLSRHWDGEDGKDFLDWCRLHSLTAREKSLQEILAEEQKAKEDEGEVLGPEYDWDETERMAKYDNYLVEKFMKGKKSFFSFMD